MTGTAEVMLFNQYINPSRTALLFKFINLFNKCSENSVYSSGQTDLVPTFIALPF